VSASAAAGDAEVALALDAAVATPCVAACCSVLQYVAAVATALDLMAPKSTRDLAPKDPSPLWRYLVLM